MKKLTKTFLSVAAVSALTAAMAASASAMTATYVEGEKNTVTLSDVATSGTSQTMIILNENADVVTEGMVEAIDQKDKKPADESNPVFTSVPVNALEDGTYYVRIGGADGSMQEAEFTVGEEDPDVQTKEIMIGDVTGDKAIDTSDAVFVARANAKFTENIGDATKLAKTADGSEIMIGDVTGDKAIDTSDAVFVARTNAKFTENIGDSTKLVNIVVE